ncbi:small ubiquitin-related modifier 2-like [Neophocaena asiaeorientalis asiaeorientalis]|uniref:Small ubiquitin-related modifier 2-like n=1 Tax=Neophocaena asiaeorientalis asiaeorientalis TaxID=1706337 RepID=A0A341C5E4_NEOAA|nr:small ubiquitin-related modifier 2-like [Neophocaena asiaeorientalis asiaeorientalis]
MSKSLYWDAVTFPYSFNILALDNEMEKKQPSWCCLCARSVRTWYLFWEAPAAEEAPALAVADEKSKEGVKTENNDRINLKVTGQDGSVVQLKIKRHTPLSKLMKAYCEHLQLEMEAEDTTDVLQQQTGGVY